MRVLFPILHVLESVRVLVSGWMGDGKGLGLERTERG